MRRTHLHATLTASALYCMSISAAELAPLSSSELHRHCLTYAKTADSAEGLVCSTYVRAFVEGSNLVMLEKVSPDTPGETFMERAFRTRVGAAFPVQPKYCINSSVTLDDIVIQMLVHAESRPPKGDENAGVLIYGTLARYYACDSISKY
jgi:Rap1a immunity proteins